ncbi:MAG: DNA polymerase III subunit delta [Gemmatimonadaceae bacterium]|nr:DNA polymerase III subunit delta [Gemmatimonadaceae bacterium]
MSSTAAHRILRDAIKGGSFDTVYYVFGDDEFQKEDAVKQLVRAAVDPATRDFNLEFRRGGELEPGALDASLQALPLMAQRRVFVLREVNALKKKQREVLDRYLKQPATDTVLILVAGADAKPDKPLVNSATPLDYPQLSADRIPRWIAHYASTELNAQITAGAAELLQAAVGTDLQQLVCELEKLCSYCGDAEIDEAAVAAIVGALPGEMMPDLLDAVAARSAARAQELLPRVLAQPKTSGVQLVMALGAQTLGICWANARHADGVPAGRLQSELFDLLKRSGSVYTARSWGSAVATWAKAAPVWTARELNRAMDALLQADVALKETRLSSDEQVVSNLIFEMCASDSARHAA